MLASCFSFIDYSSYCYIYLAMFSGNDSLYVKNAYSKHTVSKEWEPGEQG